MKVIGIECLSDNYSWLVVCEATGKAAVVDPSDGKVVVRAVREAGVELERVLCTHHHWDHTCGIKALLREWPDLEVTGHASDSGRIRGLTDALGDGYLRHVGQLELQALHVPGHTLGGVAYVFEGAVFTGDTLFHGGCGRLFEGTAEMMHGSLQKIAALPSSCRAYCGHEYTVSNLRFAAAAEPDNAEIASRLDWAIAEREAGRPTVPSTIGDERAVNPFVRAQSAEKLAELRAWKDRF